MLIHTERLSVMIRFGFCMLVVVFLLIVSIPLLLIEWIIGRFSKRLQNISSMRIVQWNLRFVLLLTGVKVTILGKENILQNEPALYVGNHRSIFDIIITYCQFKNPIAYIAKIELARIPVFSTWGRRMLCLFLDRKDLRQGMQIIQQAIGYIKEGTSVFVYPEGTRNKEEDERDLLEFHEASFRVATKTGCPVIPVASVNTAEIFEAHFPKITPRHVIIEFGAPIYLDQMSREEQRHLGVYTRSLIRDMIIRNEEKI